MYASWTISCASWSCWTIQRARLYAASRKGRKISSNRRRSSPIKYGLKNTSIYSRVSPQKSRNGRSDELIAGINRPQFQYAQVIRHPRDSVTDQNQKLIQEPPV